MSGQPNILFIVEGERLEPEVISRMGEVYGLRCDITSVCRIYGQLVRESGRKMYIILVCSLLMGV